MYKSKLIQLLKVLNRQEKEALKKWIASPLHLQHKKSIELFNLLLSKRLLNERTTNRYRLYAKLYPNKNYHDPSLKHLMNYCVQSLENFIEFLVQKESSFFRKKMLLKFYNTKKLNKYTEQIIKKTIQEQSRKTIQDSSFFYNQFELEKVIFEHQNIANRIEKTNLQSLLDHHYLAFILETLTYACEALMHQRLYNSSYNVPLLDTVINDIKQGKFNCVPAIQLYFHSYMCLKNPEEEYHFKILQDLLVKHPNTLSSKEIKSIYLMAINYCVRRINSGIKKYIRSVFELYQYGLQHKILIEDQYLNQFTHKNIISVAIHLEEYEWGRNFIDEYTPLLEEDYQESYTHYANAKLFFAQHQYDQCLQLLTQIEFDDLFLNMSAKFMLLKIYYERNHVDSLMALLASFRRFLQRKTIVAYHRDVYKNMIVLTEKLLAIPLKDTKKIAQLRAEILQTNPPEKAWLFAQLSKLE